MSTLNKGRLIYLLMMGILFLSSACGSSSQGEVEQTPAAPTIYVTQYLTQVVATALPTTPAPEINPTAVPPQSSSTWDPLAAPIYYPVIGCVASRLHEGQRAFVANVDKPVRIYSSRDLHNDPGIRDLQLGEILLIIKGGWCTDNHLYWKVEAEADGTKGFVIEGNGEEYWLLPMPPETPTPEK